MPFKNYSAATDVGRQRENNEDAFLANPHSGLWLIADGMGGHAAGEVASNIVVTTIEKCVKSGLSLNDSVQRAHNAVLKAAADGIGGQGMGSTVVALKTLNNQYEISWVGDSRAYLWNTPANNHSCELVQLTADHSYVQMLYESGVINAEELHNHPEKNIITQCLGSMDLDTVAVDSLTGHWHPHQWILLCSDGLNDAVPDHEIASVLREAGKSIPKACKRLIETALENGGQDNITVMLIAEPTKIQRLFTRFTSHGN